MTSVTGSGTRLAPRRARAASGRASRRGKTVVRGAIGLLALFVIAEIVSRSGIVDAAFLPPTSLVLVRVAELLVDPAFLGAIASTLQAWAIGLVICIVVSVSLGVVLGSSPGAYSASRAVIEFLRPIPSVALIPLAILVLGNDAEMKIALIVFSTAWPVLFNTIYGMHDVDPIAKLTAKSFGRGRLATLWQVSLPSAAPFIFTGIRIAASVALIVAISAELLAGASDGLGRWMLDASATGNRPDLVYAATIIAGLLGLAINGVLVLVERRFLSWQPALRSTGDDA
ncbi:ABC transporter permease [Microbacterium hatanonis]|uniref:ABC transporter permease n=1 Tax=Microbacterium hatanonis TaxID=404366 RepID=A0A5C8HYE8_9MICO|nr:ABC transporter permease [Microbacterium hatanonis]TXK10115.1 ABC transporter permease [Microbacterium hatanonis]